MASLISGIYSIINTFDNKRYIGYSYNIKDRNKKHLLHLRKGDHKNIHLQRAYWKYGEEYFEFQILEQCNIENLPKRENHWAKVYNVHNDKFGYNIRETKADGIGGKHSQETKDKISIKNIGRKRPDVTLRQKGKKLSEEWKANLSKSKLGKKYGKRSEEWKENISKGIKLALKRKKELLNKNIIQ